MKSLKLLLTVAFLSFLTSYAQTKTKIQPKEGFEVFTKQLIDSVVFPEEYYLNGGVNLRIAVDSLATVKLISVTPRNVDFFNEAKPFVESKDWVPATIDGVSKTSVITLPIKLNKQIVSENKKAEPKDGMPVFMKGLMKVFSARNLKNNDKFRVKINIDKYGKVLKAELIPYDKDIFLKINKYLLDLEWFPAIHNGIPVDSTFNLPITIKVDENLMMPKY